MQSTIRTSEGTKAKHGEMKIRINESTKKLKTLRVILKTKQGVFKHEVKKLHFLKCKKRKKKSGKL